MLKSAKILSMRCLVLKIPKTRCTLQSNYRGKNCTTFRRNLWSHLQLLWCSNKVLTPPLAWPHFWSTVKNSIQIFAQKSSLEVTWRPSRNSLLHVCSFLVLSVGNFDQFLTTCPSQLPTLFLDNPLRWLDHDKNCQK